MVPDNVGQADGAVLPEIRLPAAPFRAKALPDGSGSILAARLWGDDERVPLRIAGRGLAPELREELRRVFAAPEIRRAFAATAICRR